MEQKRIAYTHLARRFPMPKGTKITLVSGNGFVGEWVDTLVSREDIIMLYVHGGGFVFNSTELHRELIARIASPAKVRALSLDYSLAPEHPFPAAINEALTAYKWLLKKYSANKIVFVGDSAGGSVVLSLLSVVREKGLKNPACAVAISPATDAYKVKEGVLENKNKDFFIRPKNIEFFIDAYFQSTPRNHPIASPLYGSMKGFPPILIHADKDELMNIGIKKFRSKSKGRGGIGILLRIRGPVARLASVCQVRARSKIRNRRDRRLHPAPRYIESARKSICSYFANGSP